MDIIFFSASLFFLFLATLHYLLYLVYRNPIVPRVARFALYLTLAAQLGFFLSRYFMGGMPFGTNMYESLVFFSWCLVTAYLIITIKFKVPVVGAFVMPITLILMAAAALLPNKGIGEIPPALQSNWLPIHVTLSFMGDAFYYRLPSLDVLDSMNYRALTIGFPLLTLGIITGSVWAQYAWGSYWSWDPKETWSLITWLIYAAVLHARLTVGWRGRKAAWFSIFGFLAVLFTFLGVNLLLSGLHSYN
jgi:ABC-type transport system involved in cytochrome c biogenesis permease subunit